MTPHNKIRSSSDGYEKITAASSQPAQQPNHRPRSSSSDAKLPSVNNGATGPSDSSKGPNSPSKDHQPQRPIMIRPRCKSDSSHNQPIANQMSRRALRTISSGIALDESPAKSATSSLPLYPPPPSPSKGNHSPRCPYYNRSPVSPSFPPVHRKSLPNHFHGEKYQQQLQQQQLFRKSPSKSGDPWQSNYHTTQQQQQQPPPPSVLPVDSHHSEQYSQATHRSQNSHYSIDAGKHGFLSHGHLPHHANDGGMDRFLLRATAQNHNGGGDGYDSDSAVDSLVDSIVFHYTPGMEVPPAEYALPASILKVYGVDCECFPEEMMPNGEQHHPARMLGDVTYRNFCKSSNDRLVSELTIESDNDDVPETYAMRHDLPDQEKNADFDESGILYQTRQTNNRLELLPPIGPQTEIPQPRILPYHERKRLFEEEEKRKQKAAKKEAKQSGGKIRGDKAEKTESSDKQSFSNVESYQGPFQWFSQLAALITGQQTQKQSGILSQKQQHKHYGSINDESKQYRARGQAFLQKTEQERIKIKEKCKTDELKNVTIPVYKRHSL
ncbi:hypothetical protein HJC23_011762 [Cyclotella cryptica]|uniref:Uncharacterized protein n=1 Tax=Cyclotella cryptica TaxID=29204 RepID=A0ABD3PG81_9STRA